MGVQPVADDNYATFVQTTSGQAFGPGISVGRMGERANRRVAEEVLERSDRRLSKVWHDDPARVRELVKQAKLDLYPEIYDEDDF